MGGIAMGGGVSLGVGQALGLRRPLRPPSKGRLPFGQKVAKGAAGEIRVREAAAFQITYIVRELIRLSPAPGGLRDCRRLRVCPTFSTTFPTTCLTRFAELAGVNLQAAATS
jgi:hypothetical protein